LDAAAAAAAGCGCCCCLLSAACCLLVAGWLLGVPLLVVSVLLRRVGRRRLPIQVADGRDVAIHISSSVETFPTATSASLSEKKLIAVTSPTIADVLSAVGRLVGRRRRRTATATATHGDGRRATMTDGRRYRRSSSSMVP